MLDDVTVVIPTLNEAEGIVKVLEELRGIGASNVLVVDGGSTDGTAELARRMGARVIFQEGRGKADAVKTALRRVETPYVVVMDGDFTYPAEHVKDIVAKLREGYDEVIGARRYVEPGAMSRLFAFGNKVLTWWFNLLFGTHLTDVLSGMYGLRREAVADALFATRGFSVEVEIAAHVASAGEIAEVPIRYRRRVGKKKLKMHHGLQIALDAFRLSWLYNPLFLLGSLGALLLAPGVLLASWVAYKWIFLGVKHYVWGIISFSLMGAGIVSGSVAVLSLYIKRMERRLIRAIRSSCGPTGD
ncbi:MAG: glycosyltransferase family 2 protein [Thermoproteus sp.]